MATVLIVEDQERVARAVALLLELHGIDAVTAEGPDEAIAALGSSDIDLVLQDMNLSPGAAQMHPAGTPRVAALELGSQGSTGSTTTAVP